MCMIWIEWLQVNTMSCTGVTCCLLIPLDSINQCESIEVLFSDHWMYVFCDEIMVIEITVIYLCNMPTNLCHMALPHFTEWYTQRDWLWPSPLNVRGINLWSGIVWLEGSWSRSILLCNMPCPWNNKIIPHFSSC